MKSILFLLLSLPVFFIACNEPEPDKGMDNARDQVIENPDSMPQEHTGVAQDSAENKPAMSKERKEGY